MKTKKRIVILIIIAVVLLFPIKLNYKDGGTVAYKAILYSYTKYHRLEDTDTYYDDSELLIFPFNFLQGEEA